QTLIDKIYVHKLFLPVPVFGCHLDLPFFFSIAWGHINIYDYLWVKLREWNGALLPICPNMIGGILLLPKTLEENADNVYPARAMLFCRRSSLWTSFRRR
ncbi:MAG: hypothetical protein J6D08_13190, partial [Lachnospiraceae bacterium]|nr:hypothetical protein [Lachnospiraceae bacterium]